MTNELYTPKITIITVVYNAVDQIGITLDSIINQSYSNLEFVVVDGASTDGTLELLKKNNRHIDKFISEPDLGIYDAMNKGVRLATGDYIVFMNAGDIFHSYETVKNVADEINVSEDGLIYGGHGVIYPDGRRIIKSPQQLSPNKLLLKMPFCHQSIFAKRQLCEKFPFNLEYKIASDFNFVCNLRNDGVNFRMVNCIVSDVTSGGVSDVRRHDTWSEYHSIVRDNGYDSLFVKCYYFLRKKIEVFKDAIKKRR